MLEAVFGTYITGEPVLQDFVQALTPGNTDFWSTLLMCMLTFGFGFLMYIYSFMLLIREKHAPYPVWMHTFYFAGDLMGIFVFLQASKVVGGFWFFQMAAMALVVWCGFEIVCLYYAVTTERSEIWGEACTVKNAALSCLAQIGIFFVALNYLRIELMDVTMFKYWIFTQVIAVCVPGMFWRKRGTRMGTCWQLVITLWGVCIVTFNPFHNMWSAISPQYFSIQANPWYYVMGVGVACFTVYNTYVYAKLPQKPATLPSGKKPLW